MNLLIFVLNSKRAMDGAPGFAEHGCESKPDKVKIKRLIVSPVRGKSFFAYFLVDTRK